MENLNDKIEKVEVEITDDCSKNNRELIKEYWGYNDFNFEFNKLPSQITMKYHLSQKELNEIVAKYSNISLYLYCGTCGKTEYNIYTSQTGFRHMIAHLKKLRSNDYKCKQCQFLEEENIKNQEELASKERIDEENKKLAEKVGYIKKSVANKRWETLSEFENVVLKNAIILNDMAELKKYYYSMGIQYYKLLFPALKVLEAQHLLMLNYDVWDKTRIESYIVIGILRNAYVYQPRGNKFANPTEKSKISSDTNMLELALTASLNQNHPDCPPLSATFSPKEDIMLKSDTEYLCNLYNSRDGNVSITINPSKKDKELPKQIKLEDLPEQLRKQVEDYLRNNDNEYEA